MIFSCVHEPALFDEAISAGPHGLSALVMHLRSIEDGYVLLCDAERSHERSLCEKIKQSGDYRLIREYENLVKRNRICAKNIAQFRTIWEGIAADEACNDVFVTQSYCTGPNCQVTGAKIKSSLDETRKMSGSISLKMKSEDEVRQEILGPLMTWSRTVMVYDSYVANSYFNEEANREYFLYTLQFIMETLIDVSRLIDYPRRQFLLITNKARDNKAPRSGRVEYLPIGLQQQADELLLSLTAAMSQVELSSDIEIGVKVLNTWYPGGVKIKDRFVKTEQALIGVTRGFDFLGRLTDHGDSEDCRLFTCHDPVDFDLVAKIECEQCGYATKVFPSVPNTCP